ncbi:MAG: GtrA family protein [Bacilli bacterium]|nr:GtrA family protein [Bacilli bacterium]
MLLIIELVGSLFKELDEPKTFIGRIYNQYKEIINYLIVGVLTTIVSLVSYYTLRLFISQYLICTVISWIIAVMFAYVTNKIFVFESKEKSILIELPEFVGARIATLLFEVAFMFITVDVIHINDRIAKLIVQVFITIFNYLLSKIFVFRKR